MGFSDRFRKTKEAPVYECTEEEIADAKKRFSDFHAKNDGTIRQLCEEHGAVLDYSLNSVNDLMELIGSAKDAYRNKEISNRFASLLIDVLGVYLGDTLLKNGLEEKGFRWTVPEEVRDPDLKRILNYPEDRNAFLFADGSVVDPIVKVLKYWNNGEEDNLMSFCDVILDWHTAGEKETGEEV